MKNIKILTLIALLSIALTACEETVTGVTLPYKEQLVIRGLLESGEQIRNIKVEKTLPPLENYNADKARVTDALLIVSDGNISDTLISAVGSYFSNSLKAEAGKTYTLTAKWKGHTATAQTYVPHKVAYDEVEFKIIRESSNGWFSNKVEFFATTTPEQNLVYQGAISGDYGYELGYNDDLHRYEERDANGKLKVVFGEYYFDDFVDSNYVKQYIKNAKFVLLAYDKQFYDYFVTRYNGETSEGIFGNSGLNVAWNIKGDGIGMFIGWSKYLK